MWKSFCVQRAALTDKLSANKRTFRVELRAAEMKNLTLLVGGTLFNGEQSATS